MSIRKWLKKKAQEICQKKQHIHQNDLSQLSCVLAFFSCPISNQIGLTKRENPSALPLRVPVMNLVKHSQVQGSKGYPQDLFTFSFKSLDFFYFSFNLRETPQMVLGEPRASWRFQDLEFLIPDRRNELFVPKLMSFTQENSDWPCLDDVATS